MSVIYNATIKNARMQVTLTAYDANALPATMEIGTAGMAAVLAIVTLQDPSFSLAADVLTLLGVPLSSAAAIGAGVLGVLFSLPSATNVVANWYS